MSEHLPHSPYPAPTPEEWAALPPAAQHKIRDLITFNLDPVAYYNTLTPHQQRTLRRAVQRHAAKSQAPVSAEGGPQ